MLGMLHLRSNAIFSRMTILFYHLGPGKSGLPATVIIETSVSRINFRPTRKFDLPNGLTAPSIDIQDQVGAQNSFGR